MASLIDAFPRRPIGLSEKAKGAQTTKVLLVLAAIPLAITAVFVVLILGQFSLYRDLGERGVEATTLNLDGSCTTRRISGNTSCYYAARYQLRPQEGGGEREGSVHFYQRPITVMGSLPPTLYDPQDPSRILTRDDLEAGVGTGYYAGIAAPLAFALLFLGLALAQKRKERRMGSAQGTPVLVPVTDVVRRMPVNEVSVTYRDPGSGKTKVFRFDPKVQPFLVTSGSGSEATEMLALRAEDGGLYPIDSDLAFLDLSEDERRTVLSAIGR